jgi:SagB-type dehydrogenase family enzyme
MPERSGRPAAILELHDRSALDPARPAAAPLRLERASEPIPFRRWEGAPRIALLPGAENSTGDLGGFLDDALGLVGWKRSHDACFGLRVVPSAGNCHPTEAHVVTGPGAGLGESPALWHYSPFDHALERRAELPAQLWRSLGGAQPAGAFHVLLSTVPWRTAWKYGERAFRLTQLDLGHALAALAAAARLWGWDARWVDAVDEDLELLLGLGEAGGGPEAEHPLALVAVGPARSGAPVRWYPPAEDRALLGKVSHRGRPTPISRQHRRWPVAEEALVATRREAPAPIAPAEPGGETAAAGETPEPLRRDPDPWPRALLRSRRSHSRFDVRATLDRQELAALLGAACGPWRVSALPWPPAVHVLLFLHRVSTLEPGLYLLPGNPGEVTALRGELRTDLSWQRQELEGLPCYRLATGDGRRTTASLAAEQAAAGDSIFTAVLLARLGAWMAEEGPWAYRRLHWEAGEIGHRLYLEATRRGLGATGLSGYWDDRLHHFLGLCGTASRVLYLIAVGSPLEPSPPLEPPARHRQRPAVPLPPSRGGWRWLEPMAPCPAPGTGS